MKIQSQHRSYARWLVAASIVAVLGLSIGCEVDSWLDPSNVGRWERTPVIMPILNQLDVIDEKPADAPGTTEVAEEDLVDRVHEYVIGSGDLLTFTIFELIMPNVETVQTRRVDELGMVRLPVLGALKVRGATPSQVERQIRQILEDMNQVKDAEVSVIVQEGRQNTYSVIGEPRVASTGIGTYSIPHPNFRLLEAMALARGVPGNTKTVYVIRSANYVQPRLGLNPSIRVDQTSYEPVSNSGGANTADLIGKLANGIDTEVATKPAAEGDKAALDMLNAALNGHGNGANHTQWIFRDGEWVRIDPMVESSLRTTPGPFVQGDSNVFDKDETGTIRPLIPRIVEISYSRLLDGDMRNNVIIRPGDVIRVPAPVIGNVYIMGAVSRPGTYALPGDKDLTLKQLIAASGNLSTYAIPDRVDLVRRLTDDQEATVRLNLRNIFHGTEPDFYLKPNDLINVGTNFLAIPLAVVRNGFRMTYGFGFVLDRNFEEEVFGSFSNR